MSMDLKPASSPTEWTQEHTERAKQIWAEYQERHDLSDRRGQIAGIDPTSGRIWFGKWFTDVADQRDAEGVHHPLFFVRVGSRTALRKGGRR